MRSTIALPPHEERTRPLSHSMRLGWLFLCDVACLLLLVRQFLCTHCNKWKEVRHKHGRVCTHCIWEQEQLKQHPPLPPSPTPSLSPPPSMFGRVSGCIDQLTTVERAAIVTLDKVGWLHKDIAEALHCSENSV